MQDLHGLFPPEDTSHLQALLPHAEANHLSFSWDAPPASQEAMSPPQNMQQGHLGQWLGSSPRSLPDFGTLPDLNNPFLEASMRSPPLNNSHAHSHSQQTSVAGLAPQPLDQQPRASAQLELTLSLQPFDPQQNDSGDLPSWTTMHPQHGPDQQPASGHSLSQRSQPFEAHHLRQQTSGTQLSTASRPLDRDAHSQAGSSSLPPGSQVFDFQALRPSDLRWGAHLHASGSSTGLAAAGKLPQASSEMGWLSTQNRLVQASQGASQALDLWQTQQQPLAEVGRSNWQQEVTMHPQLSLT